MYLCSMYEKQFNTKINFTRHSPLHSRKKLYSCSACDKSFFSQSTISEHMNMHIGKFKCAECDKCYGSSCNLEVHQRSHLGEKVLECTVCGKRVRGEEYSDSTGPIFIPSPRVDDVVRRPALPPGDWGWNLGPLESPDSPSPLHLRQDISCYTV